MMEEIKKDMYKAFDELLAKYASIGIHYEYSGVYGSFLVSIDTSGLNDSALDSFSELLLSIISRMQEKYGEEAPLFCLNEEWFSMTSDAQPYVRKSKDDNSKEIEWSNANVYRSIIRMRQLLCSQTPGRVSSH